MAAERGAPAGGPAGALLPGEDLTSVEAATAVLSRLSAFPAPAAAIAPPSGGDSPLPGLADARYQALVEQIPAVVFLAAVEGGLSDIYVSPQIETLLGFTQKEWSGNPVLWFRQLHADDRERLSREFAQICITGQPFRGIVRVWSRDHTLVWVHAEARLVRDASGRPLFLHGVAFDITEQQRAVEVRQQLLLEQQARAEADRERERLREMLTNLPGAIAVLGGHDHAVELLNPAARALADAGQEVIGMSWEKAFPGFPAETGAIFERAFRTGEPFAAREWRARSPRWQHERFFDFLCQPLRDRAGAVTSLLIHLAEVTEQRLAQQAAEEGSRRASLLAAVSRVLGANLDGLSVPREVARLVVPELADVAAVEVVQPDGSFQTLALVHREPGELPPAARLWEIYPQPLDSRGQGSAPRRDVQPQLVSRVNETALAAVARDAAHLDLLRQLAPASYIIVPIRSPGHLHGVLTLVATGTRRRYGRNDLLVAEDVAQRAAMALDNARLYREVQEASRLKDEFLATLSHELRTPLNAIVGWAELLRDGAAADTASINHAVEIIVRNAYAQNELISDILDVSRIIAGKLVLKLQVVDVAGVITAAMDTVRLAAEAKGIQLRALLGAGVGPVLGDPDRLRQVVWNLLSNAIKFASRGGQVEVRMTASGATVEIVVEDDGPGISPSFLPYIFERFRQADSSTTRRHGGLGLGLAIVRHLVELHGGTVEAANRVATAGASFRLCLPLRDFSLERSSEVGRAPAHAETTAARPAAPLAGIRVMVVDNDADALELVVELLQRSGARVLTAASAAAAFDLVLNERFEVLLCDIEMPDEDGYSLLRRIRALPVQRGGATPAAAVTAYAASRDSQRSREAGFQLHLAKPLQPARLLAAVASLAARPPAAG